MRMENQVIYIDFEPALKANSYTRKGYTFIGWNTAADGSGTAYRDGASVKNLTNELGGTVTLYAQWWNGDLS